MHTLKDQGEGFKEEGDLESGHHDVKGHEFSRLEVRW